MRKLIDDSKINPQIICDYDEEDIKEKQDLITKAEARLLKIKTKYIWEVRRNMVKYLSKVACLEEIDYQKWLKTFRSRNRRVYGRALDHYKEELKLARSLGKVGGPVIEKKTKPTKASKPSTPVIETNQVDIEANANNEEQQAMMESL